MRAKYFNFVCVLILAIDCGFCLSVGNASIPLKTPEVTLALEFSNFTKSPVTSVVSNFIYVPNDDLVFLEISCRYKRPVTWSLKLDTSADYTISIGQMRTIDSFEDPNSYNYVSTVKIKLTENLLRETNFTCYQVDFTTQRHSMNEVQNTTVVLNGQRNPTKRYHLVFKLLQIFTLGNNPNINNATSSGNMWKKGFCKVTYWIKTLSLQKFEWNCKISDSDNGTNTIASQSETFCATESHCAIYQERSILETPCFIYINPEDECEDCKVSTGLSSSVLICETSHFHSAQVLLFSPATNGVLPQQIFPGPNSFTNATLMSLIFFKPIPKHLILLDEIIIECHVSEYIFSSFSVFSLKYTNSQEQEYLNLEEFGNSSYYDFQQNMRLHRYKLQMVERFWKHEGGLERIYCHAPVWNTDKWISKYKDVVKLPFDRPEHTDENIFRYVGQRPKVTISPLYPPANLSLPDYLILHSNLSKSDEWRVRINCTSPKPFLWKILYSGEETGLTAVPQLHRRGPKLDIIKFEESDFYSSLELNGTGQTPPFTANCVSLSNQLSSSAVKYSNRDASTEITENNYILKPPTFKVLPFFTSNNSRFQQNSSTTTNATEYCPVFVYLKVIKASEGMFEWNCVDSQNLSVILESRISTCKDYLSCNVKTHASMHFSSDFGRCLKVLQPEETCNQCVSSDVDKNTNFAKYISCRHPTRGNFYQFVYKFEFDENLHFHLPTREKLLHLSGIQKHLYFGQEIQIKCSASPLAFSSGLQIGIIFGSKGDIALRAEQDYINITTNQVQIQSSRTVKLSWKGIICFAPRTDSTEFTNVSIPFEVHESQKPVIIGGETMDNETFFSGGKNETLRCEASGIPKPVITWGYPVSTSKNFPFTSFLLVNEDRVLSTLLLKYVLPVHSGVYSCMARSVVGTTYKYFNVSVIDPPGPKESSSSTNILLIAGLSAIALLFFSIMIFLFWRIWFLQISVKKLSESDIKQFRDGVSSNEIKNMSADDIVNSIIYCQPYNHTLEISRSKIQIDQDKKLGEGNFGFVCFGYILKNPAIPVALKQVKPLVCLEIFKSFLAEIKVLSYLGEHTNIVKFHGACTSKIRQNDVMIALEFCENGSLKEFLSCHRQSFEECLGFTVSPNYENTSQDSTDVQYGLHRLLMWCLDIVNACDYMETKRIVHGDLASRNVLLTKTLKAKISDFGLARVLSEHSNYAKSPTECPLPWKWLAPESLTEKKFSSKSDVWSFGITLWEIFALGEIPYPGVSWSLDFINLIKSGLRPDKPRAASDGIFKIMGKCWAKRPEDRPNFNQLKETTASFVEIPPESTSLHL